MTDVLSTADRARLEELFERAADMPASGREVFVELECGSNLALRDALARLVEGLEGEDLLSRVTGPSSRAGMRVGPYRLLERIGTGGMGEVYSAEQLEPMVRRVALKLVKPGMDSDQVLSRFKAERQAMARMTHPNIAQAYDGGAFEDGTPYFVMELVNGEPITEWCDRRVLSTRARLELFLDVCAGVQHAHQKGVIHRDLKPSNLLVTEHDGRALPKVIDFGVARATAGHLAEYTQQTMAGQVVGTIDYMSPEQADPADLDVDTRSDVYSLGVVLYQLLSGLLPFDRSSSGAVALGETQRAILEEDPPTPSTRLRRSTATATSVAPLHGTDGRALIRQLSGDLDWICMKALEKDPGRRYTSVSELAADIRRHLAGEPVLAGRPDALYRARKFVRRHRVGVSAAGLVAVALLVALFGVLSSAARGRELARLSDGHRIEQLIELADSLWPAHPDLIPGYEAWLAKASTLASRFPEHRARLDDLRALSAPTETDEWHIGVLEPLVARFEQLIGELMAEVSISEEFGWSVPRRLAFARALESGFAEGGEYSGAWSRHLPAIRKDHPGMAVQMGLVPLGRDPDSLRWEFAHLMTGTPARRVGGVLEVSADTGVVLVLIPGGTFTMGSQWKDKEGENYDPNSEFVRSGCSEGPLVSVSLEAFLLSKFEMTQGQWVRATGTNLRAVGRGGESSPVEPLEGLEALKPVNNVDWVECKLTSRRLGLALPSERQWEYAARAGTVGVWSTGDSPGTLQGPDTLQGYANVYDETTHEALPLFAKPDSNINDHHARIAVVGSFLPNDWGLHDVHGNVSEICSNSPYPYGEPVKDPEDTKFCQTRGGSNKLPVYCARSACRMNQGIRHSDSACGLRPMRILDTD